MDSFQNNPFALLTFLAAPAILTNASCVLTLSTSNRFGLAIDRVKSIASDIEQKHTVTGPEVTQRLEHLRFAERRVVLLVRALTFLYVTVGSFVAGNLISLLGAVLFAAHQETMRNLSLIVGILSGVTGVGGLLTACGLLIRESRLAVYLLTEETHFKARHYYPHPS